MTLQELEIELVKRGAVTFSAGRSNGVWVLLIANEDILAVVNDNDLETAIHKALVEYDKQYTSSFCVGNA